MTLVRNDAYLKIKYFDAKDYNLNECSYYVFLRTYYKVHDDITEINKCDYDALFSCDDRKSVECDPWGTCIPVAVNVNDCYESIKQLGNTLYNLHKYESIKETAESNDDIILDILASWIFTNGAPYSRICYSDIYDAFVEYDFRKDMVFDSILCYVFYQVKVLLNTIENSRSTLKQDPKLVKMTEKELSQYFKFINVDSLIDELENASFPISDFYPYDYDEMRFHINHIDIFSDFFIKYCKRLLQQYLFYLKLSRHEDFNIQTIYPIYIEEIDEPILLEEAASLMGACFLKLALIISAYGYGMPIRCHNPNCQSIIFNQNNQKYCDTNECQTYRKRLKSYNKYHGLSIPKKIQANKKEEN